MTGVAVRILHPLPDPAAGPLVCWLADARSALAERQGHAFEAAGADDVRIVREPADDRSFGARLRGLIADSDADGLVVFGSGSIPLATARDRRDLVTAATGEAPRALANDRYSADVVAIAGVRQLPGMPDLATDNALPRWLTEVAGIPVTDLRRRWRLGVDIDGPLDLVLTGHRGPTPPTEIDLVPIRRRLDAVRSIAEDRRAELLVAGRTSSTTLAWLERHTASRTRALIEERGLRTSAPGQRAAASVLGALLEHDGPDALGAHLARLGDAAVLDTRVLLAHRLGADERAWPVPEDRYASDLLLPERIADPWLATLTRAALDAPIPVLLGAHTLVGPGLRLALTPPAR